MRATRMPKSASRVVSAGCPRGAGTADRWPAALTQPFAALSRDCGANGSSAKRVADFRGHRRGVMAGLGPAIHVLAARKKDVDARAKPGHDGVGQGFRTTFDPRSQETGKPDRSSVMT